MLMINERISPNESLLRKLDSVPLGRMYPAAFRALMRLQVWFTGRTHELMLAFGAKAHREVISASNPDGTLESVYAFRAEMKIMEAWGDTWKEWMDTFEHVRMEAAMIAFGVGAVYHDRVLLPALSGFEERAGLLDQRELTENVVNQVYDPQLRILLDAAGELIYPSGLNLSGAIWKIDREAREGIANVILKGVERGDSAWNIAKELEGFPGAGADCPRWTSTRLYGLSATDKLTSTAGLLSGDACNGQGVSYNALRLARTEVQKIHNLANDKQMLAQPWVQEEQIHLSAAHPEEDICDDTVRGGRDGQGIYTVGEIELPLHPNCLCFKTAVLMPEKEFTSKLGGWLRQEQAWPELDAYASDLGVDLETSLRPAALNLAVWLFGEKLDEWMKA